MEPKPKFVRPFAPIDDYIMTLHGQGHPPYEIARRIGWTAGGVKRRVKRLRKAGDLRGATSRPPGWVPSHG